MANSMLVRYGGIVKLYVEYQQRSLASRENDGKSELELVITIEAIRRTCLVFRRGHKLRRFV